jgi:pSer/pThr/pTyr-binding forkhead associated (FHA) protein
LVESDFNDETGRFNQDLLSAVEKSLSSEELRAISSLPADSALLIVRTGAGIGARYLLDAPETLAGRHPDAEIFLDDVTVSRKHAEFVRSGQLFSVRDLGSMNGTYLNSQAVAESVLKDGDEVRVGKFRLTFFASPRAAEK